MKCPYRVSTCKKRAPFKEIEVTIYEDCYEDDCPLYVNNERVYKEPFCARVEKEREGYL